MKVEMLLQQNLLPLVQQNVAQKSFYPLHIQIDTLPTQKSIHYELSCSRHNLAKVRFLQMLCGHLNSCI